MGLSETSFLWICELGCHLVLSYLHDLTPILLHLYRLQKEDTQIYSPWTNNLFSVMALFTLGVQFRPNRLPTVMRKESDLDIKYNTDGAGAGTGVGSRALTGIVPLFSPVWSTLEEAMNDIHRYPFNGYYLYNRLRQMDDEMRWDLKLVKEEGKSQDEAAIVASGVDGCGKFRVTGRFYLRTRLFNMVKEYSAQLVWRYVGVADSYGIGGFWANPSTYGGGWRLWPDSGRA